MNPRTTWQVCRKALRANDVLHDVYVVGSTSADWRAFLSAVVRWPYETRFVLDGVDAPIPKDAARLFREKPKRDRLLRVGLGSLDLCCHFFGTDSLEFHVDPSRLTGPVRLKVLLTFMRRLGRLLDKEVVLTPDRNGTRRLLEYSPTTDSFVTGEIQSRRRAG
jgi:hypothetical protein